MMSMLIDGNGCERCTNNFINVMFVKESPTASQCT